MTSTIVIDGRTIQDHFPGIGRYTVNLAQSLAQVAPNLDLALLHDPSATSTRLTLPDLPRIACPASPFSIRQQWMVPERLRRAGARLYHSPYYLMPYRPGVSTVLTCHDLTPLILPQYYSALQRLIYRLTHALALKTAQVTIAVSQATRVDLLRHFHIEPQRIIVIPEAADAHFCPQPPEAIAAVRLKYRLPDSYILYLGSNKPHKNLGRLIKAWKISNFKFQISNFKLVIAGHWEERYPEAKQRAQEAALKDRVTFIGPVDEADLPALYSGATLFAFPSLYEGFGLPVLEAMACGTPVICSHVSSLPEVAGEAALFFDPTDVKAIAAALSRLLGDMEMQAELRERGLRRATELSWEQTALKTLSVYQRVSGRPDD